MRTWIHCAASSGKAVCVRRIALALALAPLLGCGNGVDGKPIPPPTTPAPAPELPPEPEPAQVTGVEVAEVGVDFVRWTWDPVEGATRYQVLVYPDGGKIRNDPVTTEETFFQLDGLEPSQGVGVRVRAIGQGADGPEGWPWSGFAFAEALPPPPRECSHERERAENYSDFVSEWDGTPFRLDVIRLFPGFVAEADLDALLVPVAQLDAKIERQLGYRIVEMGEVIPVPEGTPPDWNKDIRNYHRTCPLPRESGQVQFFYLDDVVPPAPNAGAVAFTRCGSFAITKYRVGNGWPCPGCDWGGPTMHELFHLFGFAHIDGYDPEEGHGVVMSRALDDSSNWPGAQSVTWQDIDALRCIFPEGG